MKRLGRQSRASEVSALFLIATLTTGSPAWSLPSPGDPPVPVHLGDAWGRGIDLSAIGAKPILVVYEDRESASQNQTFKAMLSGLASQGDYRSRVVLLAVADLQDYNFWPARPFVTSAIKNESRKQKTSIFCDWDGQFRVALGLQRGMSNILLYGKNGKALFAHAGPLSGAQQDEMLALLAAELL